MLPFRPRDLILRSQKQSFIPGLNVYKPRAIWYMVSEDYITCWPFYQRGASNRNQEIKVKFHTVS